MIISIPNSYQCGKHNYHKIETDNILVMKVDAKYLDIWLKSGTKYTAQYSIKRVFAMLPEGEFAVPHRKYIVRLDQVERLINDGVSNRIKLKNVKEHIPVARRCYKFIKEKVRNATSS